MIVVDARRDSSRTAWRTWRRRLHGAVERALRSETPATTWRASLPALAVAAEQAMCASLKHQLHQRGRDLDAEGIRESRAHRAEAEALAGLMLGPKRIVQLLCLAGIDFHRALRLLEVVGPTVGDAVACLEVVDVVVLDDEGTRGAA